MDHMKTTSLQDQISCKEGRRGVVTVGLESLDRLVRDMRNLRPRSPADIICRRASVQTVG